MTISEAASTALETHEAIVHALRERMHGLDAEAGREAVYRASTQRLEDIRRTYDPHGVLDDAAGRN